MHSISPAEKGYNTNISWKHNYLLLLLLDLRKYWYFFIPIKIVISLYPFWFTFCPLILVSYSSFSPLLFPCLFPFFSLFLFPCLFPFFSLFLFTSFPFFLYFFFLAFSHIGEVASAAAIQRREGIETLGPRFLSAPARIPKTSACGDLRG